MLDKTSGNFFPVIKRGDDIFIFLNIDGLHQWFAFDTMAAMLEVQHKEIRYICIYMYVLYISSKAGTYRRSTQRD